jgi:hypothetical protein
MFFRSFKLFAATSLTTLLLSACGGGGDPAPAPTGLTVTPAESSVSVSWDATSGVEYWLFYGPTSIAPADASSMAGWIGLPGGNVLLNLTTSPRVISGLVNGTDYSFTANGRTDGGPGGPGATPVIAVPRLAGATWTAGAAITNAPSLRGVAHSATVASSTAASVSTYVAGGVGGAMFASNDGAIWTAITPISSSTLNSASYGGGSYKLVGDSGIVLTSSDAVTWNARSSGTTNNLYGVAHNALGVSVAVGAGGTIIYSGDGTTWATAGTVPTNSDLYAVTYSSLNVGSNTAGTWVAVGAGGTTVQSADGITWTTVATGITTDLRGIASGITTAATTTTTSVTTLVAVGASGALFSSTDGVTWISQAAPVSGINLNAVTYGTQFIAAGDGGTVLYSADAVLWKSAVVTPGSTNDLFAVVRGTLAYAAVGAAGTNLFAK